jgi:hypothetical protein
VAGAGRGRTVLEVEQVRLLHALPRREQCRAVPAARRRRHRRRRRALAARPRALTALLDAHVVMTRGRASYIGIVYNSTTAPRHNPLCLPAPRWPGCRRAPLAARLGFGRIIVSEVEPPNLFADLVSSG